MVQTSFLFFNLFASRKITPVRLYNFGIVVLGALQAANNNGQFDAVIATVTSALTALFTELSGVDTGITDQKTDTRTVDQLIVDFYTCMSNNEGVIAKALGGKTSVGFLTFYPKMQSEYTRANRTTMPVLTARVDKAADKYAAQLGADLTKELKSFAPLFIAKYAAQQAQIINVNKTRGERSTAFLQSQLVLTAAVYTVGAAYPGDAAKCHSFFPFKMLQPPGKRKRYTLKGNLEKDEVKELANYTLNKTAVIVCGNTGVNAGFALWLAASPADPMPADPYVVNAGDPLLTLKANKLGDLTKKPFVMIKNTSDINLCSYEITFVGLKKALAGAVVSTEEEDMEVSQAS